MSSLTQKVKNSKVFVFLFRSRIYTKHEKPYVQILYLDKNHELKNPSTVEPFELHGCVVDSDSQLRKIGQQGGSLSITLPSGWLKTVSHEGYVKGKLIVEKETNKPYILVCKPELEEVKA